MCEICLHAVCPAGCPNARTHDIYKCDICGEGIEEGEEYIYYDNSYYHADCIAEMTVEEIANKLLNTRVRIAEEE